MPDLNELSFAPPVAVPAERELVVDFARTGNSLLFRGWGWSAPEEVHTWTIGRSSRLYLQPPDIPSIYLLVLETMPFLWGEESGQRLRVFVNGDRLGDFMVREPTALEVEVPWTSIAGREAFAITFEHPDAATPRHANGADDDREIALAFERISLFRKLDNADVGDLSIAPGDLPLSELMMQFESLGQNCEFGLVQRQCGAEPLSLLRFASTPLRALLVALRARFDGLGSPGQLDIEVAKGEYLITDRAFGFLYHSWVNVDEATPEALLRREERRLPFLRQKLIEDLEEGRKIFLYHGMEPLSRASMLSLLAALRTYGPAILLWVELADEAHPPGTVEAVTTGLLKGYMDRFAPGENAYDLSFEIWLAVCRNAYAMTRGR